MCRLQTWILILLAGLLGFHQAMCRWALPDQEQLIMRYYSTLEPGWRTSPPPLASSLKASDEMNMPRWYGNSSQVGPSPYDFKPRSLHSGERKTQILFLFDFADYLQRMNSHSYEIVDAALAHPRVEVDVWGEGWADWDDNLTLSANIANRRIPGRASPVGCGYYDIVWSASNYPRPHDEKADHPGCGTVRYHQLGDCHSDECIEHLAGRTSNITASKYAFELLDMLHHSRLRDKKLDDPMQLFTHSPDAANPWDYFPLAKWSEKTTGAVLFGAAHDLYTIRPLLSHAIKHNRTFITAFSHPGFTVTRKNIPKTKLRTYKPGHASYAPQRRKRQEFADGMRNAQICVFDSSMEKKAIRKYAQALLSGCVVAADLPTEHEEAFRNFMIVLRPGASIQEINTIVYEALQDPVELQRKALAGFAYAREFLTNTRKVDRIIQDVVTYREGRRGYSVRQPYLCVWI